MTNSKTKIKLPLLIKLSTLLPSFRCGMFRFTDPFRISLLISTKGTPHTRHCHIPMRLICGLSPSQVFQLSHTCGLLCHAGRKHDSLPHQA
uniref:Uncharacterized protein n=1 Tax=Octactis speculum TaxID=3111310 RepID=A0A7S2ATB0_9STRA